MRPSLFAFLTLLSAAALAQTAPPDAPLVQHYTVKVPSLDGVTDADASPMVCRAPQGQSDSRLPGPRLCKTQRQWDELHAQGLDVSADGKSIVASEKYRSLHSNSCGSTSGCN